MPRARTSSGFPGLPDPETQAEFYAGVPARRLIAWLLDSAAIALLTGLALPFTAFLGLFVLPLLFLAVSFAYRAATLAAASATPGMRIMAIELRDRAGRRLDATQAVLHTALYTLALALPPLQLVSAALMALGPRGQGLGDLLLGTAALRRAAAQ